MGIETIFIYVVASILLFGILAYFDKKSTDNYINHVIISVIYIILVAGFCSSYKLTDNNDNIFLVVVFELLIRIFYVSYVEEKSFLKNNRYYLKIYFMSIVFSYLVNILFINKVNNVMPGSSEVKVIIWICIIIYLYNISKKYITFIDDKRDIVLFNKDKDYIVMQYAKFKNMYYNLVNSKYKEVNNLIYTIMIYENYNRPSAIRKIDRIKYKFDNEEIKMGIMQVKSKNIITDEESIDIAIKELEGIYIKELKKKNHDKIIENTLKKYYSDKDSVGEFIDIYNVIEEFDKR